MIYHITKLVPGAVLSLYEADTEYVLTGSRLFGNFNPWSDYDFFTQNSEIVVDELQALGFWKNEGMSHYEGDSNLIDLFHTEGGLVTVQLVRDFDLKVKAQNLLLGLPTVPWADTGKRKAQGWWNWAYRQLESK